MTFPYLNYYLQTIQLINVITCHSIMTWFILIWTTVTHKSSKQGFDSKYNIYAILWPSPYILQTYIQQYTQVHAHICLILS